MKKCNIVKARKFKKKNKKNRERADVYGCIGIGGGWGIPATHCNARLIRCKRL